MKKVTKSTQSKLADLTFESRSKSLRSSDRIEYERSQKPKSARFNNIRTCPECGLESIFGMPGGRDATCGNCGFKDPCCYD